MRTERSWRAPPVGVLKCKACDGYGVAVHVTSYRMVEGSALATEQKEMDCSACNGFGWLWSDGVAPTTCVERNVACGRVRVCFGCTNPPPVEKIDGLL